MRIKIIGEYGYDQALYGLGLSYGLTSDITFDEYLLDAPLNVKLHDISMKLYDKGNGHNKFLRSIEMWLDVDAPRYFWSEADTYLVGSTKQSESTMHTMMKQPISQNGFESNINDEIILRLEQMRLDNDFMSLKNSLPEGYLQRRTWSLNYMVLRNIIKQRSNHRLCVWRVFCSHIMEHSKHLEYFSDLSY